MTDPSGWLALAVLYGVFVPVGAVLGAVDRLLRWIRS